MACIPDPHCFHTAKKPIPDGPPTKVQSTLQGLDALLGPDEDESKADEEKKLRDEASEVAQAAKAATNTPPADASPEELKAAEEALLKKIKKIDTQGDMEDVRLQAQELLDVMTAQQRQRRVPVEDVRRFKTEVLLQDMFWLTGAEEAKEFPTTGFVGGHLFRGNLRGDEAKVIEQIQTRTKEVCCPCVRVWIFCLSRQFLVA